MRPVVLKSILKRTLKNLDLYHVYRRQRAITLWERVCGKEVAKISKAIKLRGNVLTIAVVDHIWAAELTNFTYQYMTKYTKFLGTGIVTEIRFKTDPQAFLEPKKSSKKYDPENVEIPKKEIAKAKELASGINDERVRELMEKFFINKFKHDRWLKKHGGTNCFSCGVMLTKGLSFCPHCLRTIERENAIKLKEALEDAPWLSYKEALKSINPISEELYDEIKTDMISKMHRNIIDTIEKIKNIKIAPGDEAKTDTIDKESVSAEIKSWIIAFAMLSTGNRPAKLTDDVLKKCLSTTMYSFFRGK
jgi:predicted nucleic acid-binding Zn ribbon protein